VALARAPPGRGGARSNRIGGPEESGCASSVISTGEALATLAAPGRPNVRCSSPRQRPPPHRLTHRVESPGATRHSPAPPTCASLVEAITTRHDCGQSVRHASEAAFPVPSRSGYDHAVYGADVTLAPPTVRRDPTRAQPLVATPRPGTPEGEVVAGRSIAYVCHDFDDAVRAGILEPARTSPTGVRDVVARSVGQSARSCSRCSSDRPDGAVGMTSRRPRRSPSSGFNFERSTSGRAQRQAER